MGVIKNVTIHLENLPRKKGKCNKIDWRKSVGFDVEFEYNSLKGTISIVDCSNGRLRIIYDYQEYYISTSHFMNGQLGTLLGIYTSKFKVDIGTIISDNKRNLLITDSKTEIVKGINYKFYKYTCNICGWTEGWITENHLLNHRGCACCNGKVVVEGINDVTTTEPWMVKYFQGGYNEAKLYTRYSEKRIHPICPECGSVKKKSISVYSILNSKSIGCTCGDGFSYPEKFVFNVLEQLKINFTTQLSKVDFDWIENFKYDFYIPSLNMIIETHGGQHYKGGWNGIDSTIKNDNIKMELANANNIDRYVVLDCRNSDMNWIKNALYESDLCKYFDFNTVDFDNSNLYAITSNAIKECCFYWNEKGISPNEISKILKINTNTVRKYLNKGNELGWCKYDGKSESKISAINNLRNMSSSVVVKKGGELLGVFNSISDLCKNSLELFGVVFKASGVSACCIGKIKTYKGHNIEYLNK